MSDRSFKTLAAKKVIIGDGAMGTAIQAVPLTLDDFTGLEGCNEILVRSRPQVIAAIHESYLRAGADVIETNSFGSAAHVLAEFGLADQARKLSQESAALARSVAAGYPGRFVAGSVGPGTKLISLAQISYDELFASYFQQCVGLLEGGIDLFQIETCQDLLQIKCVINAARAAMREVQRQVPLVVTVTMETTGTMLVGSDVTAALCVLESLKVDMIGLNCATGPDLMVEHIQVLKASSRLPLVVIPNAGLPQVREGKVFYDLTADELAKAQQRFVNEFEVGFVGGCCGTTPEHIKALSATLGNLPVPTRTGRYLPAVSSLFSAVPLDQDGSTPLIVGERCNANGSKAFREHLIAERWDAITEMAKDEVQHGAHVLDVCTAFVGRDEVRDMREVTTRLRGAVTAPLMIDTTQLDVLESTLKLLGGRCIINSINLEDGIEKFDAVCRLARDFGAALVALTIDEEGMAKTVERKVAVAQRMVERARQLFGIQPEDLLIDPLTFTIGSGDEDSRGAGVATLEAIAQIKAQIPGVRTILGLSNISFGLAPYSRQVLNSVYLHEALRRGLDAAILHQSKILPLHAIDPQVLEVTRDLIFDRRREGYDPLFSFIEKLQGASAPSAVAGSAASIEERLQNHIINGTKTGLEQSLDEALTKYTALEIINSILLAAMKVVGDRFADGTMQLPFVLQSAETMKKAVAHLQQFMEKTDARGKGTMVLATVRGDVHDIGKNLVDIILSNNGYTVVNLGIKQPLENILAACQEHNPDAVGLSGLLVKSTFVMKENLEEMSKRGMTVPVICGGAALTRAYVEDDLRKAYTTGKVYYGADAFTGLQLMDELTGNAPAALTVIDPSGGKARKVETRAERTARQQDATQEYVPSDIPVLDVVPTPPFWGSKVFLPEQLSLEKILSYVNKKALYANQWQYRRGSQSTRAYREFLEKTVDPLFVEWCQRAMRERWLGPRVVYGYYPCVSERNSLVILDAADHSREIARFDFPRQPKDRRLCIADFFRPRARLAEFGGVPDVIAFHVVTMGPEPTEYARTLFAENRYSEYLHVHGLSVEAAEALAEYWHVVVRQELGIAADDAPTLEGLFRQQYRGSRYSFGYAACPRLEDQKIMFDLLDPSRIGVELGEEFQLHPEQSTSALIVHHPAAKYFSV